MPKRKRGKSNVGPSPKRPRRIVGIEEEYDLSQIHIEGAKTHNLKDLSLRIPHHKLVVFCGVSGSGKSSLVFETLFAESQRQLFETFTSFQRMRFPSFPKPDVDVIRHLTTAIVIDQKRMGLSSTSTVGTATDVYTHLRVLFSRFGSPSGLCASSFSFNKNGMCLTCKGTGLIIKPKVEAIFDKNKSLNDGAILYPGFKVGGWWLKSLERTGRFNMDQPLKKMSKATFELLCHTPTSSKKKSYDGVVSVIERSSSQNNEKRARFFDKRTCPDCDGTRLNERALSVTLGDKNIAELSELQLTELLEFMTDLPHEDGMEVPTSRIVERLQNLIKLGAGYLSLSRPVGTLSGGESQRVKMAKQLSCDLVHVSYIFDEPSIGLHSRDIMKIVELLKELRDKGNSVFVVEHDASVIMAADAVVEIGPRAGRHGGELMYQGPPQGLAQGDTLTGQHMRETGRTRDHPVREAQGHIWIKKATLHNLKNISVKIPREVLCVVTGVSGSGKSSLINGVFCKETAEDNLIVIDQSPVGRSSRSNPATYTKVFDDIRKHFATKTGKKPGFFSFNSAGACRHCEGSGKIQIDMIALESVALPCEECEGRRYNDSVLALKVGGKTIADVLDLTVEEATAHFKGQANIVKKLAMLSEVGLGYITLGQSVSSLSGGESQRLKVASELSKSGNIYVADEPTTGLHMADIERLMGILHQLADQGNTVIVIEHNLDVISQSDWVIDLGPEGGMDGGYIVGEGPPEDIALLDTPTGHALREYFQK